MIRYSGNLSGTVSNPAQLGGCRDDTERGWHQKETIAPSISTCLPEQQSPLAGALKLQWHSLRLTPGRP
jgi:hypothetical protein